MKINLQPTLENNRAILYPLQAGDFGTVYAVAADPVVWEQHPNRDRWKQEVFTTFFEGAMQSGGAFRIVEKGTGQTAGCTRFYGYDEQARNIHIGYTFYGTAYWGTGLNLSVKRLMLDYIFQYVDTVLFHIGAHNLRSQIAIGRLGAQKIDEVEVAYYGEPEKLNFVYAITKEDWLKREA
jgi:N-acetyltransferase